MRGHGIRTAAIVAAAALLTVGILLAVVLSSIQGGTRDAITLPDPTASTPVEQTPEQAPEIFVAVDKDNIQAILDTMARPEAYHQTLTVSTLWSGGSSSRTIEIWRSGALAHARIAEGGQTRCLTTDGTTLWVWYEGDSAARALDPDETVTFDDLVGIPTYETLTALEPADILDAGFVSLDGRSCLYIASDTGGGEDRCWVDASTQLLCRADALDGDEQTYQLRQSACEVLSTDDGSLRDAFTLPDGTSVTGA